MDVLYNKYIKQKTKENWKFWMFSFLLKPLFETYKKAMEEVTGEVFINAAGKWVEENMSLVNLRPAILTALRKVSSKTKIVDKPEVFKKDVMELITHVGDENGNDSTKHDAEVKQIDTYSKPEVFPQFNTTTLYHHQISSQSLSTHDHQPNSYVKILNSMLPMNGSTDLKCATSSHGTVAHEIHTESDLESAVQTNVTNPSESQMTNVVPHDVQMTCGELWDVPASLPANESSSSLSEIVFTSAEERTLYDSILNSFGTSDSMSNIFPASIDSMSDISHDLFPACITTASTTCYNTSSFPVMTTHQDDHADHLMSFPTFSDLELVPSSMESSSDHVTFMLDSKDGVFTDQNTNTFSTL